jgi:hypothetical protein
MNRIHRGFPPFPHKTRKGWGTHFRGRERVGVPPELAKSSGRTGGSAEPMGWYRGFPGAQKRGTWGTHLQWLYSLLPTPGPPAQWDGIVVSHPFRTKRGKDGAPISRTGREWVSRRSWPRARGEPVDRQSQWDGIVVSHPFRTKRGKDGVHIFSGCTHFSRHLVHLPVERPGG